MDHVLEDLDFACENISRTKDETGSLVTKWVAYALKSRICLFEASFRKYHTELGLTDSADEWYQEAVRAAETVMKESGHSIYTGEGTDASFRSLFISDKPVTSEVMLASCADAGLAVLGEANWWWTSGTYGARFSMIRTFVNTFLNTDGTPFTDRAGYETTIDIAIISWLTVSGLSISLFIPDGFNWLDCHGAIGRCQSGKHS